MKRKQKVFWALVLILVVVCVVTFVRSCNEPKPPVVTPTNTPRPTNTATFTPTVVVTTVVVPTETFTPTPENTLFPTETFTPVPTFTFTPTLVPVKDYCWWNEYAGSVVCYPRYQWHPRPNKVQ